jgi:hypothetical protein
MPSGISHLVRSLMIVSFCGISCTGAQGFRPQEIGSGLGVVYAVTIADVNGDGKPDLVALTATELLWFENPGWQKHVVASRITERDHVAIAPYDVDGDGNLDFAVGADWQSTNTKSGGSLHWVSHAGKVHAIASEPTLHRIGWADVDGDGRSELIVVPLHGKGTSGPGWADGPGARILVFRVPKQPASEPWSFEVASDSLHIAHNFIAVADEIWVAAKEGVHALRRDPEGKWTQRQIAEGSPGEIKMGRLRGKRHLATVEPWHGNSIVIYEEPPHGELWARTVIETGLNQAHALGWGDFDGDGHDELIVGWRGKPWGLARYDLQEGKWSKSVIGDGVAVEDLAVGDLDGDGRPEIVAGGRATANVTIYWPVRQ